MRWGASSPHFLARGPQHLLSGTKSPGVFLEEPFIPLSPEDTAPPNPGSAAGAPLSPHLRAPACPRNDGPSPATRGLSFPVTEAPVPHPAGCHKPPCTGVTQQGSALEDTGRWIQTRRTGKENGWQGCIRAARVLWAASCVCQVSGPETRSLPQGPAYLENNFGLFGPLVIHTDAEGHRNGQAHEGDS